MNHTDGEDLNAFTSYAWLGPLQMDVSRWVTRNFGNGHPVPTICGLGEEVGEVMRALTKRAQGVRGTHKEWTAELRKELGDVVIKLADFATEYAVDLQEVMAEHWSGSIGQYRVRSDDEAILGARLFVATAMAMQTAADWHWSAPRTIGQRCADILVATADLADYSSWHLDLIVLERWAKVGARDFIADPLTGGREKTG